MEDVDVPESRVIPLLDDLKRLIVPRRDKRAARLTFVKKLLLGDLVGFGMVRDKNDLNVLIARAKELIQQKKEAPRQIFFHGIHGTRGIHDAEHDGVGLRAGISNGMMVAQVVLVEGKAPGERCSRLLFERRLLALHPGASRTLFVQTNSNTLAAKTLLAEKPLDLDLP